MSRERRIFLVAGEESGDQLGAGLMRALGDRAGEHPAFSGVGGAAMAREGLVSLFPISDIAVMGINAVIARLPTIVRRVHQVVDSVVAARPDVLVVIDSAEFCHAVARRVRHRAPGVPIVNYVSPSVWAWRPGRAPKMRAYIDHVLALKPFEPAAHLRLGGPPCTYVGHPLVERLGEIRPGPGDRPPLGSDPVRLLVLPGSRRSEVRRLMEPFGLALGRLAASGGRPLDIVLPAVAHLEDEIRQRAESWPTRPRIVLGEAEKYRAMRGAQLALAASGTVTLELALAGIPSVVAYKVSRLEEQLRFLVKVPSIVLANLILGENAMPEYIQWDCTPEKLEAALRPLLRDTPERQRQTEAFGRLDAGMEIGRPTSPSQRAAEIVCAVMAGAARRGG